MIEPGSSTSTTSKILESARVSASLGQAPGYVSHASSAGGWSLSMDAAVSATARRLLERMLVSIGDPPVDFALWNGQIIRHRTGRGRARIIIRDPGALRHLMTNTEFQFGEMYTAGRIDVDGDLAEFLELIYRAQPWERNGNKGRSPLRRLVDARRNSLTQARRNIRHHYDFGNDFYKLWLDSQMVYTCAYFRTPTIGLDDAQTAKMDHVCRKLRLKPGEKVIEAGCGWGALALHMARKYRVSVAAYNISREQMSWARDRARAEGLDGQVEFIEDDYRNASGKFDVFASVGMLEHVGPERYREFGSLIDRLLTDRGRGLIHSIGRDYPRSLDGWIARHIFPSACPPSLSQMMTIFEPAGFSVLDVENLRLHYAKTLEHWLQRFEAAAPTIERDFNAAVVRTWRLYLAGSLAAFRAGNMQLFQVLFTRSGNNRIPWTRSSPYECHGG